jgi:cytoskeletal protein RodZ
MWFLAQSDIHRMGSSIPTPDSGTQEIRWFDDMALVMGIGLILMLALALWVKFFRKSSETRVREKDAFRSVPDGSSLSNENSETERRRKKRRRRRRDHRPRNPTLAETGGLPAPKELDEQDS